MIRHTWVSTFQGFYRQPVRRWVSYMVGLGLRSREWIFRCLLGMWQINQTLYKFVRDYMYMKTHLSLSFSNEHSFIIPYRYKQRSYKECIWHIAWHGKHVSSLVFKFLKGFWVETNVLNQSRKITIFNICGKLQSHMANAITIVTRL